MKTFSIISISLIVMFGLLIIGILTQSNTVSAGLNINSLATLTPTPYDVVGLAIGVREPESIGGVLVLQAVRGQYWNQDQPDVGGDATAGDKFGDAVVWGDFDGNGFPDLAIGNPKDSEGNDSQHGSVNVLYGTSEGFSATGSQYFDQEILAVGMPEEGDLFGLSLAAGDFNHDGYDDLAVGAPGEALGSIYNAGVLDVLYGSDDGLTQVGIQVFDQGSEGVYGNIEQADLFGFSLAVGDFDGDEYDDLAVGVPYEDIGSDWDAGQINLLYGSHNGLEGNDEYHHQDTFCDDCVAEQGDRFGFALAAGDFDGDGYDDLAVGVPYEYLGSTPNVGLVNILYGTLDDGLEDRGTEFNMFNQDTLEIPDCTSENMDLFGYSLAAGDLNGDGYSDLIIGSPGESHWFSTTKYSYGGLNVMYGSEETGLTTNHARWIYQWTANDGPEANDQFGFTLAVNDINGDGYDDLAVGVPYEDLETMRNVGLVHMLFGSPNYYFVNAGQVVTQKTIGLGETEAYDMFGISLAIWPFPFPYTSTIYVYLPLLLK